MSNRTASLIVYLLLIWFSVYVVRAWARWFRSETKLSDPRWRSGAAAFGFAASTVSLLIVIAVAVHAFITGGLPYYHPIFLLAFRVGLLTALCGVGAATIGKGQLETPAVVSSLLCLLVWIIEGVAQ
ncbi:MAG: hypothetical protein LAO09_08360 [Acidobacteriia bacterium]|nr:hypothetical protein [Terriglobia bacterium]